MPLISPSFLDVYVQNSSFCLVQIIAYRVQLQKGKQNEKYEYKNEENSKNINVFMNIKLQKPGFWKN